MGQWLWTPYKGEIVVGLQKLGRMALRVRGNISLGRIVGLELVYRMDRNLAGCRRRRAGGRPLPVMTRGIVLPGESGGKGVAHRWEEICEAKIPASVPPEDGSENTGVLGY